MPLLETCSPPEFKPVVYRRFVDDIFVLFKSKDYLLLFAKYMNTRHKNFKFKRPVFFNLRSRLYNCFNKTLPQYNIKVIFQSKYRLSNLFRFKDSISKELRSHIVYKFLCSNCNILIMVKLNIILM